jgi:hypothetical protein
LLFVVPFAGAIYYFGHAVDTEEVKTSKTEKWFSTKLNKGFFQGLSFSQDLSSSQVPQIFIITDFSKCNDVFTVVKRCLCLGRIKVVNKILISNL